MHVEPSHDRHDLRTRLGFTGGAVTDSLAMAPARRWAPGEAAVRAMLAGNDLLLMPPDLAAAHRGLLDRPDRFGAAASCTPHLRS